MAVIDFSKIEDMLDSSLEFSLTEEQYKKLTGRQLPKNDSYLKNKSALSKLAKKKGLKIKIQERTISFEKE